MIRKTNRILALASALVLALSMMLGALSANAAEGGFGQNDADAHLTEVGLGIVPLASSTVTLGVAGVTDTVTLTQTAIQAAIDAAGSGDAVTVDGSFSGATSTLTLTIPAGVTVKWSADYSGTLPYLILLASGGSGTFEVIDGTISGSDNTIEIANSGFTFKVSGGTVSSGIGFAIESVGIVEVADGTVSSSAGPATINTLLGSSSVTVSGGSVSNYGTGRAINSAGNVVITDGTVSASTGFAVDATGTVDISGGFVFAYGTMISTNTLSDDSVIFLASGVPTISSPGLTVAWDKVLQPGPFTPGSSTGLLVDPTGATAVWAYEGGQSGIRYTSGADTGFFAVSGVAVNVCVITGTGVQYTSLDDALAAIAGAGRTIKLLADIDYAGPLALPAAANDLRFDLNGFTLTIAGYLDITPAAALALWDTSLSGGGKLSVNGDVNGYLHVYDGSTVEIDGDKIERLLVIGPGTTIDIKGSAVAGDGENSAIEAYDEAVVNIGGNVTAGDVFYGIVSGAGSTVTVKGDVTVGGRVGVWAIDGGTITIDGSLAVVGSGSYIEVGAETKTPTQHDSSSILAGYLQYSDIPVTVGDPKSYVWLGIAANTYSLMVTAGTGGSVSGTASGSYAETTAISATATADSGYHFIGWTVSGVTLADATAATAAFSMPANAVVLTANFETTLVPPVMYAITLNQTTGGTATVSHSSATAGTTITLNATPATGYSFVRWDVSPTTVTWTSGGATNQNATFTMPSSEVTVTPVYQYNNSGTQPDDDQNQGFPQTGDYTGVLGWGIVMLASVLGTLLIFAGRKQRYPHSTHSHDSRY